MTFTEKPRSTLREKITFQRREIDGDGSLGLTSDAAFLRLKASLAKDGAYALDQISKVPFYLHQKGIEAMEYSEEYRTWFDVIPGEKKETIRPALVKDGRLLKKGIVSGV